MRKQFFLPLQRFVSFVLVLVLMFSFCSTAICAQEAFAVLPIEINDTIYYVNVRLINNTLYCRADQWSQAANCLWKLNTNQNTVYLYYETPVILASYNQQEYVVEGDIVWVPFFDAATATGVYFTEVSGDAVHGHRAKPLAVFYKDMDRMFAVSNYRVTEMILSLGGAWVVASSASRTYAILSSMSISGFVDAISGKMDQDMYDAVFIEMLKTDESLLGAITNFGDELARPGKVINLLQKSLDEGSALWEWLSDMGFTEGEIRELIWSWSQDAYGSKALNDWADYYEITKASHLLEMLGLIDDMALSVEADAKSVLAMQEVFAESESDHIRYATQKAIGARTGSKAITAGLYTIEYLGELFIDNAISDFEDAYEKYTGITSLDKLRAEVLVWVYDEALSLTEKSNAIMYSEIYSLVQLELANYYYDNHYDHSPENNMMMHSVALLYLRSCLASWKLYEFDNSLSQSINNATTTIEAEISNLMTYTEEELLQNGTSDDCMQAIIDFVHARSQNPIDQTEMFDETYWHMSFGQSLGFNYVAKFSTDGTFVAQSMGSGEYENGTYTYSSGELTIVFDVSGFGYPDTIKFRGDGSGFSSLSKYPMQVGEEYYTITPLEDGGVQFDEPAESEPQVWEGDGTYEYSLVFDPNLKSNHVIVYLREPFRDIVTAMDELNAAEPGFAGICVYENEYGNEVYSVEYVHTIAELENGAYQMCSRTLDGYEEIEYIIESDGYVSVTSSTAAWSGWGLKLCWFKQAYLEIASDCTFADDRRYMTAEEMQYAFDQGYAVWGEYGEVHITVHRGKITEFIVPYAP